MEIKAELGDLSHSYWQIDGPTVLFELKLWVYRIYKEVDYWTKTAITTLQALPSVLAKERVMATRVRITRSARR